MEPAAPATDEPPRRPDAPLCLDFLTERGSDVPCVSVLVQGLGAQVVSTDAV